MPEHSASRIPGFNVQRECSPLRTNTLKHEWRITLNNERFNDELVAEKSTTEVHKKTHTKSVSTIRFWRNQFQIMSAYKGDL